MLGCNCSIVGDEGSREALVIDPGDEIDRILSLLNKHQLKLKQIKKRAGYSVYHLHKPA